jgi:chromate transporter
MMRGGLFGAIGAWFGFTFPSGLLMILAAYGLRWTGAQTGAGWLHGLKIVAVAVVAQAVWAMATKLCVDRRRISFAIAAAVVILLSANSWIQVLTIGAGALAGWKLIKSEGGTGTGDSFTYLPSWPVSAFSLGLFIFCLLLLPSFGLGKQDGWLALFDSFYRAGSLVFGGGHVVLPLLQAEVVPRGWVDNGTFLAGYGMAQALPGPLFSFAAYLGAAKTGNPTGWLAGLWCLFAILLPPMLLVNGLLPVWNHLRSSTSAQALLAGANATVVGILLAALYQPIWTSAIDSPRSFSLAVILFGGLQFWKIPSWILVITGGIAGGLFL